MSSHANFTEYLDDHPESAALLDALRLAMASIGPTEEHLTRSQVAFKRRRTVAVAWAPGQYLDGRGAPLVLTLDLAARDPSGRWKEIVEPRPGHFIHHLELDNPADLDDEVLGWLRTAWDAAA